MPHGKLLSLSHSSALQDDGLGGEEMQEEQADEAVLARSVTDAVEALRTAKGRDGALLALRQLRKLLSVGQYPPVRSEPLF